MGRGHGTLCLVAESVSNTGAQWEDLLQDGKGGETIPGRAPRVWCCCLCKRPRHWQTQSLSKQRPLREGTTLRARAIRSTGPRSKLLALSRTLFITQMTYLLKMKSLLSLVMFWLRGSGIGSFKTMLETLKIKIRGRVSKRSIMVKIMTYLPKLPPQLKTKPLPLILCNRRNKQGCLMHRLSPSQTPVVVFNPDTSQGLKPGCTELT